MNDLPVPPVMFHNAKGFLSLDRAVHSQQCAMDAAKVVQNLAVHSRQLLVDSHCSASRYFLALRRIRTAVAILALVDFLLPAILIAVDILSVTESGRFPVQAAHDLLPDLCGSFRP